MNFVDGIHMQAAICIEKETHKQAVKGNFMVQCVSKFLAFNSGSTISMSSVNNMNKRKQSLQFIYKKGYIIII